MIVATVERPFWPAMPAFLRAFRSTEKMPPRKAAWPAGGPLHGHLTKQ
jgi:hypothetical protein